MPSYAYSLKYDRCVVICDLLLTWLIILTYVRTYGHMSDFLTITWVNVLYGFYIWACAITWLCFCVICAMSGCYLSHLLSQIKVPLTVFIWQASCCGPVSLCHNLSNMTSCSMLLVSSWLFLCDEWSFLMNLVHTWRWLIVWVITHEF